MYQCKLCEFLYNLEDSEFGMRKLLEIPFAASRHIYFHNILLRYTSFSRVLLYIPEYPLLWKITHIVLLSTFVCD